MKIINILCATLSLLASVNSSYLGFCGSLTPHFQVKDTSIFCISFISLHHGLITLPRLKAGKIMKLIFSSPDFLRAHYLIVLDD